MIGITGLVHGTLSIENLSIPPGITSVIGENGSGKTTLLRLIAGIDEPEQGSVTIGGISPRMLDAGYVHEFPDRNLLFSTVSDEIASSLRFRDTPCPETRARVTEIAAALQIGHLLCRPARDLSGGEKALTGIAAALVHRPQLLVLDEYDSHLDPALCARIDTVIRTSGANYIVRCTQRMDTAAGGDFVVALEKGRVAHAGTPREVFPRYENTPFFPRSWRGTAC